MESSKKAAFPEVFLTDVIISGRRSDVAKGVIRSDVAIGVLQSDVTISGIRLV